MSQNNWYVITGGPCTGKTTLLAELGKHGYATVPEAARLVIDEGFAAGKTIEQIREDEKLFQYQVLRRKEAIEAKTDKKPLTFFDRGMHDTIAYLQSYSWPIDDEVKEACLIASYEKVFLLDPLPFFEEDGGRTEDASFTQKINQLLEKAYEQNGLTVIHVPVLPIKDRVRFILEHVNKQGNKKGTII